MFATALTLALAGAAVASPVIVPNYPPKATSDGFRLVVNVTDPSRDLSPSIQNTYVTSIHTGAGLNYVGQSADQKAARTFFVNGTAGEVHYGQSHVLSNAGYIIEGLGRAPDAKSDKNATYITLNGGSGGPGIGLTHFPDPYTYLYPDSYYACKEPLAYYGGKEFVVIKNVPITITSDGQIEYNIPVGCAPVNLVSECAELTEIPDGFHIDHQFVSKAECYKDVRSLDWTKYGP